MAQFYGFKAKTIRKRGKLSAEFVAKKLSISKNTLSNWETGKIIPAETKIRVLADVIGASLTDISDIEEVSEKSLYDFTTIYERLLNMPLKPEGKNDIFADLKIVISNMLRLHIDMANYDIIVNALKTAENIIFYVKNVSLHYTLGNNGFAKIVGVSDNSEIKGKIDEDLFTEIEATRNEELDRLAIQTKQRIVTEGFIPGTKNKCWGIISKIPLFTDKGSVNGVFTIIHDITERKVSERLREILEEIVLSLNNRVIIFSADTNNVILVNDAFKEYYGSIDSLASFKEYIQTCVHPSEVNVELARLEKKEWPEFFYSKVKNSDNEFVTVRVNTHIIEENGNQYYLFEETDI